MAPTKKYVGAIDQGTSSTRFMIFDHQGAVVATFQKEHTQHFPQAGWVEHDALEIWERTCEVVTGALGRAKLAASDLAAVGITNQRETTLVWDRHTGKPLHNAVVWNCTRTNSLAAKTVARLGGKDALRAKTGLPIASYFSATKLVWLFENVPGLRDKAAAGDALFGTIDTWLIWKLTGGAVHATDVTNASRTLLMDLASRTWDVSLLSTFGVPAAMLPDIRPSSGDFGKGAASTPLAGVPLTGVLGDQQAALFGQSCFEVGEAKSTYGTGAFIMMNTGAGAPVPSKSGLLTTVAYQLNNDAPVYALEGGVAYAGALIQWLRDNLKLIKSASDIEALARTVDDSGGLYVVPAFAGLFAPHWREDARAAIVGMTAYNTNAHVARAALDASALQVNEVLGAMKRDAQGAVALRALKVDGGMTANELLMQFQADMLDVPVTRPKVAETTALGAAYAAGLADGVRFWKDVGELKKQWAVDKQWEPKMDAKKRARYASDWDKAVSKTLGWAEVEGAPSTSTAVASSSSPATMGGGGGWRTAFIAAAAGLALGLVLGRRHR